MTDNYKESYLAVDSDFEELVRRLIEEERHGKVYYFDPKNELEGVEGSLKRLEKTSDGIFLRIDDSSVRLDKIITLLGKPGPAYEEYDNYANACLACNDMGQF